MALNLYISNNITNLANKLAINIKSHPLGIFQKEFLIVQTEGMSKWISVKMAEKNQIFSNFEFLSPNSLLFDLFKLAGIRNKGLYETNNLKWIVYKILGSKEFQNKFNKTYQYFEKDTIKKLQLATKTADLFDQYVIYRSDYIRAWNDNKTNELKRAFAFHEEWQKWIWLQIKEKYRSYDYDKVQMRDLLLEKFENDIKFKQEVIKKFPRISLFGFSVFTPFHLEVFVKLSRAIVSLDFYLFSPTPESFWFHDIAEKTKLKIEHYSGKKAVDLKLETGNQLLMNQGKSAKNLFLMLFESDDFINVMDNESLVVEPKRNSLLHIIQNDIYNNTPNSNREKLSLEIITDGSLQIASNHTPAREIENLYSYILKQIDENGYSPKDIIVQTTNIDLYSPYIKAIFDNTSTRIPYTIADRSFSGTDNLVGIVKTILSLQKDEFTSEDILQLLEFDAIRKKFEISNLKIIRTLVKSANIRHGIEGEIENDTLLVSWKYGLERILLGYAIKDDSLFHLPDKSYSILPLDIVEGEYAKEGLKLKRFVDTLIEFVTKRNKPRKLMQWSEYVLELINEILEIDDKQIAELNYILDKLTLSEIIDKLIDDDLPYEVFSKAFIDTLYADNRSSKFISGKVTFCSMIPMRSIPYKIIAILGLNKNIFPRQTVEFSFDLMQSERRWGDRNVKQTDKYLFFETLLSAEEKLYLSYIGQDIKDNSEIPPSSLVDEVVEYIANSSDVENLSDNLVIKHSLNNYNRKYYSEDFPDYYTYLNYGDDNNFSNIEKIDDGELNVDKKIRLKDLISFYKNPYKWYFNKKLKIFYNEEKILLPKTEIFELDNLEKYTLKNEIVKSDLISNIDDYLETKIISGKLPLKNMSIYEVEKTKEELKDLMIKFNEIINGSTEQTYNIDISENNYSIYGDIANIYNNKMIFVNVSKNNSKTLVQLQISRWICSKANLPVEEFILINKEKDKLKITVLEKSDQNNSSLKLNKVAEKYFEGFEKIIPFYPKASFAYLERFLIKVKAKTKPIDVFINAIENETKYDLYLQKLEEEAYFDKYKNDESEIYEMARLIFDELF